MKGLKVVFGDAGAVIDTNSLVQGTDAQVQNLMVNLSTNAPAPVFENRGTGLLSTMVSSGFVSLSFSQHAANFAALDGLYFSREYNPETPGIRDVNIFSPKLTNGRLMFSLEVKFQEGTIITTALPV